MRLPPLPTLSWTPEGFPRSDDIGDVYFSGDGLSEKRAVFLAACRLPDAWADRDSFVIGELGLGAGLNLLATWDLWRTSRPRPTARLDFVSIEGALMSRADAQRTHALWPELADLSARLLDRWPQRARGIQRIALPDGVVLTLMIDDVAAALPQLAFHADAWFLDGFAPAKNPGMWSPEAMSHIARLSAPGARLATYAVAGEVRRNLEAAGFTVEKKPGHGRKKERLEAWLTPTRTSLADPSSHASLPLSGGGDTVLPPPPERGRATSAPPTPRSTTGGGQPQAIIIGAGIAGACAAHALASRNIAVTVLDAGPAPGHAASGNPLALVMPRLDATDTPTSRALIAAFLHARRFWLDLPRNAAQPLDARRLPGSDTERQRFAKLLADPPLDPSLLEPAPGALLHHDAIAIRPAAALPALLAGATQRFNAPVTAIADNTVTLATGEQLHAGMIVACAGMGLADLAAVPLEGRLGQLEHASAASTATQAIADGGYVLEAFGDLVFGATFEPAPGGDPPVTDRARAENLATLARLRPDIDAAGLQLASRAAIRATTPDRLPFAGPPPPANEKAPVLVPAPSSGVRLIGGLGARGFLWAPLLAELVVSGLCGEPPPAEQSVIRLLDPARFAARAARRGR